MMVRFGLLLLFCALLHSGCARTILKSGSTIHVPSNLVEKDPVAKESGSVEHLKSGSSIRVPAKFLEKPEPKDNTEEIKEGAKESESGTPAQQTFEFVSTFSAELGNNTEYPSDSVLVFDNVISNEEDHYDNETGMFICPDNGLYMFVWSIAKVITLDVEGMRCYTKLRTGSTDYKLGPKTSYRGEGYSGHAQMSAVLRCSPQQAITVTTLPWSQTGTDVTAYRGQYTTFNGYKIESEIAFTAELSQDEDLFPQDKLRFDNVLANFGGYYDNVNYVFRCPDLAVYVFSVSTNTRDEDGELSWSNARLMMDHNVILDGPMTYRATDKYDSGTASITAVVQCTPGASIYVEAQKAHDFPYNSYSAALTSFTGARLYNTEDRAVAFSAVLSLNHTTQTPQQRLVYDRVITNIGGFFDGNSGRFICPDYDYYLFTWGSVMGAGYGGVNHLDLIRGERVQKALRHTHQPDGHKNGTSGTSSVSTIIPCIEGKPVWVASRAVHNGVYMADYTFFTGYEIPGRLFRKTAEDLGLDPDQIQRDFDVDQHED